MTTSILGSSQARPAVLGLAVMFWVAGFDLIYATQDVEFDVEPTFVLELDAEWLAYLEEEDPPR